MNPQRATFIWMISISDTTMLLPIIEPSELFFQDYVKYYFTAAENIAVGHIEEMENETKISNAASASLANTVIEKLPDKYDQILGRRFSEEKTCLAVSGRKLPSQEYI